MAINPSFNKLIKFIFVLLLCTQSIPSSASNYNGLICAQALLDDSSKIFRHKKNLLIFKTSEPIHYPLSHPESRYLFRIEDVFLVIKPEFTPADLLEIATQLSQGIRPAAPIFESLLKAHQEGKQEVLLTSLLPEIAQTLTNKMPDCDGPNCWNAALKWFEPSRPLQFVSRQDIEYELEANYVRLPPGEAFRFGTLIAIRTSENGERYIRLSHTAVMLSPELLWHKPDSKKESPWTYESMQDAIDRYLAFPRNLVYLDFYWPKPL